jgi:hypothetical protein
LQALETFHSIVEAALLASPSDSSAHGYRYQGRVSQASEVAADLAADTSSMPTEQRQPGWLLSLVQGSQAHYSGASTAATDMSRSAPAMVQAEPARHKEHTIEYPEQLAADLPLDLVPAVRIKHVAEAQNVCCQVAASSDEMQSAMLVRCGMFTICLIRQLQHMPAPCLSAFWA